MNLSTFHKLASVLGCGHMVKQADTYMPFATSAPGFNWVPGNIDDVKQWLQQSRDANARYYRASNASKRLSDFMQGLPTGTKELNVAALDGKLRNSLFAGLGDRNKVLRNALGGKNITLDQLKAIANELDLAQTGHLQDSVANSNMLKRFSGLKRVPLTAKGIRGAEALAENIPGLYANFNKDPRQIARMEGYTGHFTTPGASVFGRYEATGPARFMSNATLNASNSGAGIDFANATRGKSTPGTIPTPKESILRPKPKTTPNASALVETKAMPGVREMMNKFRLPTMSDIIAPAKSPINIPGAGWFDPRKINVPKAPVLPPEVKLPPEIKLPEVKLPPEIKLPAAPAMPNIGNVTTKVPEVAKALPWFKHPAGKIGLGAAGIGGLSALIGSMFNKKDR